MKKFWSFLLLLTLVFSFISCGGSGGTTAEEVVFRRNNAAEPESLDPHIIEGVPEHNVYMLLFEGLTSYDPKTCAAVPGLAERWEPSNNNMTWTFYLRKNAKWTDGTPITAQTVVASWLRILNPETASTYAYLPGLIIAGADDYNSGKAGPDSVKIRALDDYTFQFDLVGPAPYAVDMLSHYSFGVVPVHVIEKHGSAWTRQENFVGNGPFKLVRHIPQDRIEVVKSDTYWDKDNVHLDRVIFYPIDDENTAIQMYNQGDIDWIEEVPAAMLEQMQQDRRYHLSAAFTSYYYEINMTKAPYNDVRVRKALAMALDRNEIVEKVTRRGEFPAYGLVPPLADYPAVVGFQESAEEAKRLLAEAGFPNGRGFPRATVIYNTNEAHKRIAEYVQQKWKEVLNIDVEIENQEWATFLDNRQTQNFDIARAGWQGDYVDPNSFLTDLLHSASGNNDGKYNNPKYDALLAQASQLPDGPERNNVLQQAEMLAIGQDMALLPFYYYTETNWIDTDVWDGWYTNILDIHSFKYIKKK